MTDCPLKEMLTVEERVCKILEGFPATRSSDRLLQEKYLDIYHNITTFAQQTASEESPSTESIRRSRQKIQASGRYLAVEEVKEYREVQEDLFLSYAIW